MCSCFSILKREEQEHRREIVSGCKDSIFFEISKEFAFFFAIFIHFCSYNVLMWGFQQMKITTEGGAKRCFLLFVYSGH